MDAQMRAGLRCGGIHCTAKKRVNAEGRAMEILHEEISGRTLSNKTSTDYNLSIRVEFTPDFNNHFKNFIIYRDISVERKYKN